MKTAILQCADTGPLESLVLMLRSVGYKCYTPSHTLRDVIRRAGCDTVLSIRNLVEDWGYDRPMSLPEANPSMLDTCDLYVDVKAHRNGPKLWEVYPRLKHRTLWYRINGGKPEHVVKTRSCLTCCGGASRFENGPCGDCDGTGREIVEDHGDEVNPPCPVLTPNQWYHEQWEDDIPGIGSAKTEWTNKAYCCWPPFYRFDEYLDVHGRKPTEPPICLIHNIEGWGYKALIENMRSLGVRCYGRGSPDGLIPHREIPRMLSRAKCMVHLKSNDAPGYALYEAMAAACPIICTRRLIWRCRMQALFSPGENCMVFDRETHDGLSEEDVIRCTAEVSDAIAFLSNNVNNLSIGMAGHDRLKSIMWRDSNEEDVTSFRQFMQCNFP